MEKPEVQELIEQYGASCKKDFNSEIEVLTLRLMASDKIRNEMNIKLDAIGKQSRDNHAAFKDHDEQESKKQIETDKKYDRVIESITELTDTVKALMKETSNNTSYVQSETYNRRFEMAVETVRAKEREQEAADKALLASKAIPWSKWLDKVAPSLITIAIMGMLSLMWVGVTDNINEGIDHHEK